jgi:hypothetical protein
MQGYKLDPDLVREILKTLGDGRMPQTDQPDIVIRHHYRVKFHEGFIKTHLTDKRLMPDRFTYCQLFRPNPIYELTILTLAP